MSEDVHQRPGLSWVNIEGSCFAFRAVSAIAVLAFALDLSGCADAPPAIGSHLPGTFAVASDAFDQRVKTRFPVGSGETALRTELEHEGFVTTRDNDSPFSFSARFHANELVCVADWVVRWSALEGKIANVEATYKEVCL
jgi:hypothetical protein